MRKYVRRCKLCSMLRVFVRGCAGGSVELRRLASEEAGLAWVRVTVSDGSVCVWLQGTLGQVVPPVQPSFPEGACKRSIRWVCAVVSSMVSCSCAELKLVYVGVCGEWGRIARRYDAQPVCHQVQQGPDQQTVLPKSNRFN